MGEMENDIVTFFTTFSPAVFIDIISNGYGVFLYSKESGAGE